MEPDLAIAADEAEAPRRTIDTARARRREEARRRREARRRGVAFAALAAGLVIIAYVTTVVLWRDPLTDLYTRWQQRQLAASIDRGFRAYEHTAGPAEVAAAAKRMQAGLEPGQPLGYVIVPRLGLVTAFVHGTRWREDLTRGPGHYRESSLPGRGATVAIAGHRTTFGAAFRHIDKLRRGDMIEVTVPYGAFRYRVFRHAIVDPDDWSILRDRGFETLVLTACHPLYSSARRWIVYARLVAVDPSGGRPYTAAPSGSALGAKARATAG